MKYYFLLTILSLLSCADGIDMQKEFDKTDIPAAVMGKVLKNGTMKFYSFGNEKWDDDTKKADENTVFDIASMKALVQGFCPLSCCHKFIFLKLCQPYPINFL